MSDERVARAGLDPCIAFQVTAVLPPDGKLEYTFLFGEVESRADVRTLVEQYRIPTAIDAALDTGDASNPRSSADA